MMVWKNNFLSSTGDFWCPYQFSRAYFDYKAQTSKLRRSSNVIFPKLPSGAVEEIRTTVKRRFFLLETLLLLLLLWLLVVVCCLLFDVGVVVCCWCCCLLFVVCCFLFVACCLLLVVCCLLFVVSPVFVRVDFLELPACRMSRSFPLRWQM